MAKSRTHKDDEDLRGELREANKIIKALKKRLRQLERSKHMWEDNNLDDNEPVVEEKRPDSCPHCKTGTLMSVDLGIKHLWTCDSCEYRKTSLA